MSCAIAPATSIKTRPNMFLLSLGLIEMAKTARRGILLKFRLVHGALDLRHDRHRNRKTFKQAAHIRDQNS
ncbi:hypothetical protein BST65_03700 [Bradyrhizobium canariense]|nr:hypothetical protein BST65_03700 [Bradyrhizobium canariense]OSI36855.1 hypothetical protein BST66_05295 [Bradyrhizobium canariense]OSI49972.1 hypothetical protein BSZ20_06290 [Bradyrhizobium canariense]OSI55576.1 hypothetical protein BST67_04895 [Bradyrhizobium canariense]OSI58981.1 hypothetical protein BSZ15_07150 [Bradyrhizobium canariense]